MKMVKKKPHPREDHPRNERLKHAGEAEIRGATFWRPTERKKQSKRKREATLPCPRFSA
ncbi:hypothetical protein ACFO25_03420 [Paenactinomyces guangxiensis]|uniref:Uncharacterized protein n=1 Tax=Paenactinomyces guangxiensis TaxID=1490290 RepID=A0A7W1WRM8_9BACL|nr:hypothetical protein [Paenactinomyces guangxiensis]MBA4494814.1 hypothetical protein [Paenactinomyces guangxiensis]MBH8591897.1 hypothetical protein [Paenactinomyces guangxiensis]